MDNTKVLPEITLADIFVTLLRRKTVIFIAFILTVAAAFVSFYTTRAEFESLSVIEVRIEKANLPEVFHGVVPSTYDIEKRIIERYDVLNKSQHTKVLPKLKSVKRADRMLFLTTRAYSPDSANDFNKHIIKEIITSNLEFLNAARAKQREMLNDSKARLKRLESEISDFAKMNAKSPSTDIPLQKLIAIEYEKLLARYAELEKDIFEDEVVLIALDSNTIKVLRPPSAVKQGRPVKPNLPLYLMIGAFSGVFLGICAVFFLEFVRIVNRKLSASN